MRSSLSRSFYSSALIIECFQNKVPIKASEVMEKGDDFSGSFIGASQASKNSSVVLLWWIFSSSSLDQQVRFGWKRRSSEIALSISAKFKTGGGWGPSLVLVIIIIIIKIHWVIKGVILLLWRGLYNGLNVATVAKIVLKPTKRKERRKTTKAFVKAGENVWNVPPNNLLVVWRGWRDLS